MAAIKRTNAEKAFNVFNIVFLTALCVVALYPLWFVAMASFSDPIIFYARRGILAWPIQPATLLGYKLVLDNPLIATGYANTLFYVVAGTSLSMVLTIMGSYALSRKGLYWNGPIMKMISFTMYFQGGLIPFYLLVRSLNLMDNRLSIILPVAVGTWNLIIMRTSFGGIPDAMEESARLDGANDWTILWRIMVPLAQATIAVIALYYAVSYWNTWFNASLFLRVKNTWPLQLVLREILLANDGTSGTVQAAIVSQSGVESARMLVKYCTIMVATVPILCVYPFLQKYFVKGVMIGSLKG